MKEKDDYKKCDGDNQPLGDGDGSKTPQDPGLKEMRTAAQKSGSTDNPMLTMGKTRKPGDPL
jgi:hypothetical protein